MADQQDAEPNAQDAALITGVILQGIVKEYRDRQAEPEHEIIVAEPVLSEFLRCRMLQMLGQLALAGATPCIVRGAAGEIHALLAITAEAFRRSYRELLADFMPAEEPGVDDPAADNLND